MNPERKLEANPERMRIRETNLGKIRERNPEEERNLLDESWRVRKTNFKRNRETNLETIRETNPETIRETNSETIRKTNPGTNSEKNEGFVPSLEIVWTINQILRGSKYTKRFPKSFIRDRNSKQFACSSFMIPFISMWSDSPFFAVNQLGSIVINQPIKLAPFVFVQIGAIYLTTLQN